VRLNPLAVSLAGVKPGQLLELFDEAAASVEAALRPIRGADRRARTDRRGQYAIDLVADAAVLGVLGRVPVAVLSEESGWGGVRGAPVTVVVDPVDGSTNASRGIPYWATSLCAVDAEGPLAALVVNQATGTRTTAVRGEGAWRDGTPVAPAKAERVEDALVVLSGPPLTWLPWKQFRAFGSIALTLCDLAAGVIEGLIDARAQHAPWDYLGGLLACSEAGAVVEDAAGRSLKELEADTVRQLIGAATPALFQDLRRAVTSGGTPGPLGMSGGTPGPPGMSGGTPGPPGT
jgi:myo-inositol-1(or 4)-monophosphatase